MNKISTQSANLIHLKEEKSQHKFQPGCLSKCADWKLYATTVVNKDTFSLV